MLFASHVRYGLLILTILLVIIFFSKWTGSRTVVVEDATTSLIQRFMREAHELGKQAIEQQSYDDAVKAIGRIEVCQSMASNEEIERTTNTRSVDVFLSNLRQVKDHFQKNN